MFKNLKVKWQLILGFTTVAGLFAATLLVTAVLLAAMGDDVVALNDKEMPLVLAIDRMDLSRAEVQQFLSHVSASGDPGGYHDAEKFAQTFYAELATVRTLVAAGPASRVRLLALTQLKTDFDNFYTIGKHTANEYLTGGREAGNVRMKGTDGRPGFDKAAIAMATSMAKFRDEQVAESRAIAATALAAVVVMDEVMLVGGLLAAALAAVFGALIVRGLLAQLGGEPAAAAQFAQLVGAGDLTTPVELRAGDNTSLMASLRAMQENLAGVVSSVRRESEGVALSSSEIAQGNTDLSSRTEEQASALEETAASMEQLSATVSQNADSAGKACQLAVAANKVAAEGGELVAQCVTTMKGINDASHKIADIIGVIDGIAFQTNILALNAAGEAARAGEQGRGFAVVVTEVRALAGRSAAKEIKLLIATSVGQVNQGTRLVAQAGDTMQNVVSQIRGVSDTVAEISAASAEQSAGASQVVEAVGQMDRVTQQNAALVEEMSAAADGLTSRARELVGSVAVFKLEQAPTPLRTGQQSTTRPGGARPALRRLTA